MARQKITRANICDRIIITLIPLLLGIIGSCIFKGVFKRNIDANAGLELVKTVFDVWGVLLGFVITAVSILLTVGENSFIRLLIDANHMQNIIYSYVVASFHLFLAIVFALILLFTKIWCQFIFYIFMGMNITIVFAIAISLYFLFAIALSMHESKQE